MADYLEVWQTQEVKVGIRIIGESVVLKKTRGHRQKTKQVTLKCANFPILVKGVVFAVTEQPTEQIRNSIPVGVVHGGCGVLIVEWAPYCFGNCNALIIRGRVGCCVAVEQKNIKAFAL